MSWRDRHFQVYRPSQKKDQNCFRVRFLYRDDGEYAVRTSSHLCLILSEQFNFSWNISFHFCSKQSFCPPALFHGSMKTKTLKSLLNRDAKQFKFRQLIKHNDSNEMQKANNTLPTLAFAALFLSGRDNAQKSRLKQALPSELLL